VNPRNGFLTILVILVTIGLVPFMKWGNFGADRSITEAYVIFGHHSSGCSVVTHVTPAVEREWWGGVRAQEVVAWSDLDFRFPRKDNGPSTEDDRVELPDGLVHVGDLVCGLRRSAAQYHESEGRPWWTGGRANPCPPDTPCWVDGWERD